MYYSHMDSPVGRLLLAGDGENLTLISFPTGHKRKQVKPGWQEDAGLFVETKRQLAAYFSGDLTEFDLPLAPQGTPFQLSVWQALLKIPFGETTTYGRLAETIGRPTASRAVGAANGDNPMPIVIPCHRVVGSTGKLTGFGGGIEVKAALLTLEGVLAPDDERQPDSPFAAVG